MNCEGWSNEARLGISSNQREDGPQVGVTTLVNGRLGLRQVTGDRNWDGFARWVSRDGSMGSEMGFCCMVATSQRGRQQDGSFSPLTLSVSLCTTLYSLSLSCLSLFVLPLAFSSFFFNLFFRLFWTTGLVVFFFFF